MLSLAAVAVTLAVGDAAIGVGAAAAATGGPFERGVVTVPGLIPPGGAKLNSDPRIPRIRECCVPSTMSPMTPAHPAPRPRRRLHPVEEQLQRMPCGRDLRAADRLHYCD